MPKMLDSLAKNTVFVILSGFASIISFVVSILNEKFILWAILTCCFFTVIIVVLLVNQNAKMFKRLDELKYNIFNQNIDLEYDENKDVYQSSLPVIVVLTSFLSPETASENPSAIIQIDYPPQLDIDFNITSERIFKEEANSNCAKFKVTLQSEATVLTIGSITLVKGKEDEFVKTDRRITFTFESALLSEVKKEKLLVSV